jgi:hypothetical protein
VRSGSQVVCEREARVVEWKRWEEIGAEENPLTRWMRREGMLDDLLVGVVGFRVDMNCPGSGRELVMLGHDPENATVPIE